MVWDYIKVNLIDPAGDTLRKYNLFLILRNNDYKLTYAANKENSNCIIKIKQEKARNLQHNNSPLLC